MISYILILLVLHALVSVLQSDWVPDFRIHGTKSNLKAYQTLTRSPGDVSPKNSDRGLGQLHQTSYV